MTTNKLLFYFCRSRTQGPEVGRLASLRASIGRRLRRYLTQNHNRPCMSWDDHWGGTVSPYRRIEATGRRRGVQGGSSRRAAGVLEGWWCSTKGGFAGAEEYHHGPRRTQGVANDGG